MLPKVNDVVIKFKYSSDTNKNNQYRSEAAQAFFNYLNTVVEDAIYRAMYQLFEDNKPKRIPLAAINDAVISIMNRHVGFWLTAIDSAFEELEEKKPEERQARQKQAKKLVLCCCATFKTSRLQDLAEASESLFDRLEEEDFEKKQKLQKAFDASIMREKEVIGQFFEEHKAKVFEGLDSDLDYGYFEALYLRLIAKGMSISDSHSVDDPKEMEKVSDNNLRGIGSAQEILSRDKGRDDRAASV